MRMHQVMKNYTMFQKTTRATTREKTLTTTIITTITAITRETTTIPTIIIKKTTGIQDLQSPVSSVGRKDIMQIHADHPHKTTRKTINILQKETIIILTKEQGSKIRQRVKTRRPQRAQMESY